MDDHACAHFAFSRHKGNYSVTDFVIQLYLQRYVFFSFTLEGVALALSSL